MTNDLTIFDGNNFQVPAHILEAFGGESNLEKRTSVNSLSYEGKVWAVTIDGEKRRLTRTNEEGDEEPIPTMRVVILDAAKNRGRTYYEGAYDPGKIGSPKCWSDDGNAPHSSVSEPMCDSCKTCPMAAKGSKITEQGKAIAACSQHRMLAVVPEGKLDSTPLRLKIAITSDWDADSAKGEEGKKGWFAFSNYKDFLISRNLQHTAAIVTKIKFDNNVAYPKLLFSPDRWLDTPELAIVGEAIKSDEVKALVGGAFTPNGTDGQRIAAPQEPAPKPAPAPKPSASVVVETDDIDGVLGAWGE